MNKILVGLIGLFVAFCFAIFSLGCNVILAYVLLSIADFFCGTALLNWTYVAILALTLFVLGRLK